jgi:hypothetical protein
MANEFYITAGLVAIDSANIGTVGTNAFYMTAGLVANDYVAAGGRTTKNTDPWNFGQGHGMSFRMVKINNP